MLTAWQTPVSIRALIGSVAAGLRLPRSSHECFFSFLHQRAESILNGLSNIFLARFLYWILVQLTYKLYPCRAHSRDLQRASLYVSVITHTLKPAELKTSRAAAS